VAVRFRLAIVGACLAVLALATPADAAFPGANGKIAASVYLPPVADWEIFSMNPDGSGLTNLTDSSSYDFQPAWSPDGAKIAFMRGTTGEIAVMNADGTDLQNLTNDPANDNDPAWSPDGTKIAFSSSRAGPPGQIYVMNSDGSAVTRLTQSGDYDIAPSWSPDGNRIAFTRESSSSSGHDRVWVMNADGTGQTDLTAAHTSDPFVNESDPDWSPDGGKLVFWSQDAALEGRDQVYTMNADGTGVAELTHTDTTDNAFAVWAPDRMKIAFVSWRENPNKGDVFVMDADGGNPTRVGDLPSGRNNTGPLSWQPIPLTYIRPKAAAPTRVSLVPAYAQCTPAGANRTHGPPLAFPSCAPPSQSSGELTIGTADANGAPTKAISLVRYGVHVGNPATSADEADVRIIAQVTDVRKRSDLSDYTGELQLDQGLRITDRDNTPYPGGPGPGTVTDTGFPVSIPCAATADTTVGSTCAIDTTAEALVPNTVKEGRRAVWQIGQVKVYDGGADGVASTVADNTLFMDEGLFVP
jgi:hypothetical protein